MVKTLECNKLKRSCENSIKCEQNIVIPEKKANGKALIMSTVLTQEVPGGCCFLNVDTHGSHGNDEDLIVA